MSIMSRNNIGLDGLIIVIIIEFNVQKVLGRTLKVYLDGRIHLYWNVNSTRTQENIFFEISSSATHGMTLHKTSD